MVSKRKKKSQAALFIHLFIQNRSSALWHGTCTFQLSLDRTCREQSRKHEARPLLVLECACVWVWEGQGMSLKLPLYAPNLLNTFKGGGQMIRHPAFLISCWSHCHVVCGSKVFIIIISLYKTFIIYPVIGLDFPFPLCFITNNAPMKISANLTLIFKWLPLNRSPKIIMTLIYQSCFFYLTTYQMQAIIINSSP